MNMKDNNIGIINGKGGENMNENDKANVTDGQGVAGQDAVGAFENKQSTNRHGKGKGRMSRFLGVLLAAAVAIGTLGTCVWMSGANEVYADDLVNTVPTSESSSGSFYSDTIETGFVSRGAILPTTTYGPGFGPHNVDGVYQSQSTTSATSFAAGLPLGTIFIDQDKVGAKKGRVEYVSSNPEILAGLVQINTTNQNDPDYQRVAYDGRNNGAIMLEPGKINRLDGPIFSVTFEDAAIKPDGSLADLVITYSDARCQNCYRPKSLNR